AMEKLDGRAPRLEHVVVDDSKRHSAANGRRSGLIPPVAELDEQPALGSGVELLDPGEEVGAAESRHPLIGKDDRDCAVSVVQRLESAQRLGCRLVADHVVVVAVPTPQLLADPMDGGGIVVDSEYDRLHHVVLSRAAAARSW